MQKSEYYNIFHNEERHFYYLSIQKAVRNFIKKYNLVKNPKILDVGSGTGGLLINLNEISNKLYGIDYSKTAVSLAKKRGLKEIKMASGEKIPYQNNTFDVVTCIDVLYHKAVKNDLEVIKEMFRVLKPNGVIIIKVPAYEWLRGNHDKVVFTRHRYTLNEIKEKVMSVNFKIKKISYGYTLLFPAVILKRLLDKFNNTKEKSEVTVLPRSLNFLLIKIMEIEQRILASNNFPFGLFIYCVATKPNKDKNKKSRVS